MIPKDYKKMSNNELKLAKMNLENEFEATRAKIAILEEQLDKLDREYFKVEEEERIRRNG